jgi:RND superfamily putative drug exporter
VFLLGRIKELHDGGMENNEAVAVGVSLTGRVITAAALLFCVAILAFSTSQIVFIKELGVGTALAVAIDATIIRAFLVPALMVLLGEYNWWAPRWMKGIYDRFGIRENPIETEPAAV